MFINLLACLFLIHPYYVSVSESVYNNEQSVLQITKKIFYDDLELVLKNENKNEDENKHESKKWT